MKQNIVYYICVCFLLFFVLSVSYTSDFINAFDTAVSEFVQSFRNETLTKWFSFISYVGSIDVYFPFVCILASYFLIRKRFLASLLVVVSLYGSRYLNDALKLWYERPRPDINTLVTATGYSFPSGHAMSAAAFLGFVAYLAITEHRLLLWQKIGLIVFATLLIFSIAISRVYLGVHYPSDILAGCAAGGGWMLLCVLFHQRFRSI
ncbi:phosphatase PAP2 family protein [Ectobacillus panaciterrae]|uniref:phosphatase PAP2 family protein n=1 Tax=Ectobacillus panaciterrae TaxID=363872 RepID=UPI00040B8411|nr:phosphatase PAP2 family protein [Ectobacillus panaciterrae]